MAVVLKINPGFDARGVSCRRLDAQVRRALRGSACRDYRDYESRRAYTGSHQRTTLIT